MVFETLRAKKFQKKWDLKEKNLFVTLVQYVGGT